MAASDSYRKLIRRMERNSTIEFLRKGEKGNFAISYLLEPILLMQNINLLGVMFLTKF